MNGFLFRNANITLKYFAKEVLRHFRMYKIVREWKQEKSLLHGVVLLSQWFNVEQKHLTDFCEIDHIIQKIADHVQQQHLIEDINTRTADKNDNFSTTQNRKKLNIINKVLFEEMRLLSYERRCVFSFTIFDIIKVIIY